MTATKICALPECENKLTRKQILWGNKFCSHACKGKARMGANHPLWKGKLEQICVLPGCENDLTREQVRVGNKFCSRVCKGKAQRGAGNPWWTGGGYQHVRRVKVPGRGLQYVSRLVMEDELGRELTSEEIVHHIDRDTSNNDLENLLLLPSTGAHSRLHHEERRSSAVVRR